MLQCPWGAFFCIQSLIKLFSVKVSANFCACHYADITSMIEM